MGVNFTDEEQNSIALMNIGYYDSKAEYMVDAFSDVTKETGTEDFNDQMKHGFIQDITCGTYNNATDDFTPWRLTNMNILDTILNAIHDDDFIGVFSGLMEGTEDVEQWSYADWIREYTEVYEVFIIDGRVYVNQD